MKKTTIKSARWVALLAGLALGASAQAASTWTFTASGATATYGSGSTQQTEPLANTSYASNGVAGLSIDGVYAGNGASNVGYASGAKWNSTTMPDSNVLSFSGGLGMCSGTDTGTTPKACGEPNHAIDNAGNTEGILMQFSSSVVLTSIGIGYISGDADISLWRYTGSTQPAALNTIGADKTSMQNAGWSLVGNYADLAQDTGEPYNVVNSGAVGSSWWLVTAYNSSYSTSGLNFDLNGTGSGKGDGLTTGNDYFKIYAVAGNACSGDTTKCGIKRTPEPGSLALAGLALGGVVFTRRRKVKAT